MKRLLFHVVTAMTLLAASPAFPCVSSMRVHRRPINVANADRQLMDRAREHLAAGRNEEALVAAETLLDEERPGQPVPELRKWALRVAGLSSLRLDRFEDAVSYLEQALQEFDDEPYLAAKLGEAEVGAGQLDEGLARLESLAADDLLPDADAHVALAQARLAKGDSGGALEAVNAALVQQPEHAGALTLKEQLEADAEPESQPGVIAARS